MQGGDSAHVAPAMTPISVLVVDDEAAVREPLSVVLSAVDGVNLIGMATGGEEAITFALTRDVDVVLMDLALPDIDGVEAIRQIIARRPDARIIAFTTFDRDEYVTGALAAGAIGYLVKSASEDELVAALRRAAAGEPVLTPESRYFVGTRSGRPLDVLPVRSPHLGRRDRFVLRLMCQGVSDLDIARRLQMPPAQVRSRIDTVLEKLDCRTRARAIMVAFELGLAPRPGAQH